MFHNIATIILTISNIETFINNIKKILFIILHFTFKINKYIFTDINKANSIKNYIKNNKNNNIVFDYDDNNNPIGMIIGLNFYNFFNIFKIMYPIYIIFIYNFSYTETEVWLFSTKNYRNIILKENNNEIKTNINNDFENYKSSNLNENKNNIDILVKNTIYGDTKYSIKTTIPTIYTLSTEQEIICNDIINYFNLHSKGVFYIHGNSGLGKTYLSLIIAKKLNAYYCNTYNPIDPGDSLSYLHNFIEPTKEKPLVVILDEFDILIDKLHNNNIQQHKYYSKEIFNKKSWNQFLDSFDYFNKYPNTILILCSNKNPDYINSLDKSYIRNGRINKIFNIKEKSL